MAWSAIPHHSDAQSTLSTSAPASSIRVRLPLSQYYKQCCVFKCLNLESFLHISKMEDIMPLWLSSFVKAEFDPSIELIFSKLNDLSVRISFLKRSLAIIKD